MEFLPKTDETIISQLARLTFGTGALYYALQIGTMLLLVLAANSAFAGFPHLASILARDGYMPHQMATFGDRLVFSNGIVILGVFACFLLILFHGDTHALIPLYAVGVFISFTLSQAGMVRRWLTKKGPHWRKNLIVNGVRRRHDRHCHHHPCQHQVYTRRLDRLPPHSHIGLDVPLDPLALQGRLRTDRAHA